MAGEDLTVKIIDEDAYGEFETANPVGSVFAEAQPDSAFQITAAQRNTFVSVFGGTRATRTGLQDAQRERFNTSISSWHPRDVNPLAALAQTAAILASQLAAQAFALVLASASPMNVTEIHPLSSDANPPGDSSPRGGRGGHGGGRDGRVGGSSLAALAWLR